LRYYSVWIAHVTSCMHSAVPVDSTFESKNHALCKHRNKFVRDRIDLLA
jgi:hypothetical protein